MPNKTIDVTKIIKLLEKRSKMINYLSAEQIFYCMKKINRIKNACNKNRWNNGTSSNIAYLKAPFPESL